MRVIFSMRHLLEDLRSANKELFDEFDFLKIALAPDHPNDSDLFAYLESSGNIKVEESLKKHFEKCLECSDDCEFLLELKERSGLLYYNALAKLASPVISH